MNEDDIRQRRLARLGSTIRTSQESPKPSSQKLDESPKPSNDSEPKAGQSAPPAAPEPANHGSMEPAPATSQGVNPQPERSTVDKIRSPVNSPISAAATSGNASKAPIVPKDLVADILGVSLRPDTPKRVYLADLASSRQEESRDDPLSVEDDLDAALWEMMTSAAPHRPHANVHNWFLACYRRTEPLMRQSRLATRNGGSDNGVGAQLQMVRDALARSAVMSATADPEDEVFSNLGQVLLAQSSSMAWDFVSDIVDAAAEQELLDSLLEALFTEIRPRGFVAGYRTEYAVTDELLTIDKVAKRVMDLDMFTIKPEWGPAELATKSFLGPYFGVSPLDGKAPSDLFANYVGQGPLTRETMTAATNTHLEVNLVQDSLFRFVNKLVRAGAGPRRRVLDFFVAVLNANHRQVAMQVDRRSVNANGFMCNLTYVAVALTDPFTDFSGAQLNKINRDYFRHTVSYNIADETKVLADQNAPYNNENRISTAPNFVTETFFIALGFLQFGLQGTVQAQSTQRRMISHMRDQFSVMRDNMPGGGGNGAGPLGMMLSRAEAMLHDGNTRFASFGCILLNPRFMAAMLHFATFALVFDVQASKEPNNDYYKCYPEFAVEAPLNAVMTVFREVPEEARRSADGMKLVEIVIHFMRNAGALRNPYLRSRMVEILWIGGIDQPLTNGSTIPGLLEPVFAASELCHRELLPALMQIWIDIEHTGRSSEFYDKFNVREMVAHVLKVLWRYEIYRRRLEAESTRDPDFFVRFVALLLNDSTYLLDEALSKLQEIHDMQERLAASSGGATSASTGLAGNSDPSGAAGVGAPGPSEPSTGGPGNEEEGEETENGPQTLESAERQARTMLALGKTTVDLLYTFTKSAPAIFVTPEIVNRFAVMLNYNLAALVGPRCNQLKVRDPVKVGFNPRHLLCDLVRVFLNLGGQDEFVHALARDERSYSPKNYDRAADILNKFALVAPQELSSWRALTQRVETAHQEDEDEEEELGEIPDEFLDPLLYELMEQPVILPGSHKTIDLSTIKSHLLSDPTDPFNRMPLSLDQVVPNTELKQQIEAFKAERRQLRQQQLAAPGAAPASDTMETD